MITDTMAFVFTQLAVFYLQLQLIRNRRLLPERLSNSPI